jgi:hypothetical protein
MINGRFLPPLSQVLMQVAYGAARYPEKRWKSAAALKKAIIGGIFISF